MATPRQASSKEAEENKRKQEVLRSHGYSQVKVDGSWGPWQEARYRAIQGLQDRNIGSTQKANVGVISLPTVAASAVTPALPIAATIGSGYMAAQNWDNVAPVLQALTTGVTKPILRTYDKISSYFYPEEATPATDSQTESSESQSSNTQTGSSTTSSGTTSPANLQPENKPENKKPKNNKGFKEEMQDALSNVKKGYTTAAKGLIYGTSAALPIGGIGYGLYNMLTPEPTPAQKIMEEKAQQLLELERLDQAERLQAKMDSVLSKMKRNSISHQTTPSNTIATPQQTQQPDSSSVFKQLGLYDL